MLPQTQDEGRHIESPAAQVQQEIPGLVSTPPLAPVTMPQSAPQLFSVVAQDLPVRELLFAIARDANVNIDVHPGVTGRVSLNAIDQTLPQILDRISRQVDIRWSFDSNRNLLIERDSEYWHTYSIDYVNVQRSSVTGASISSSIVNVGAGGGGGEGNNSSAELTQTTAHDFWTTLRTNLTVLINDSGASSAGGDSESLIINPESGVIAIRANGRKHDEVSSFINFVQSRSLRQVLIEATVVEVTLNDRYQSGVDWSTLGSSIGEFDFEQSLLGANLVDAPTNIFTLNGNGGGDAITGTLRLLSQFGDLTVLSSPKIMALNNQPAMLRVVDNKVYFSIEVEPGVLNADGLFTPPTFSSSVQTVPVGFVMTVTPQIGDGDQVTLNVRPTISRIVRFVNDPNPSLADAGVINAVPEIQIREIESVLKVFSGQIAVLGGLMQDSLETTTDGLPTLSRLPVIRNLFSYRSELATKTELIVFIRPVVVQDASIDGDLREFRNYLPSGGLPIPSPNSIFDAQEP